MHLGECVIAPCSHLPFTQELYLVGKNRRIENLFSFVQPVTSPIFSFHQRNDVAMFAAMKRLILLLSLIAVGCGGDNVSPGSDNSDTTNSTSDSAASDTKLDPNEWFTFEAGPFTIPPGGERFYCYSHTLEEDLTIDELRLMSDPVVHHVVYSKTTSPDPDGFFECDILFQNNWVPLFVAGTGDASLKMPEDAGQVFTKGTQLTMQLHLLNATPDEVTKSIPISMHRMKEEPKEKVEVVVFGSVSIALPPKQETDVISTCDSDSDMKIFSVFPHMHLQGRRMIVETGSDEENLTEVFREDPYDFDAQSLSTVDLTIHKGDTVKVTCGYDNQLDETVTFGESTTNEMCFFIGFATKATHELAGCIGADESSFFPDGCGDDPPNDIGLGATCTQGGGECEGDLLCTEDLEQTAGLDMCIGIGCSSASDCGEGGVCCNIAAAGDVSLCLPPSCVLSVCEILE